MPVVNPSDVLFIEEEDVIQIHHFQIEKFGGMRGVRDMGLLTSAVAQPQTIVAGKFLHADIFEMAAAYAFHICQNHPFHDGNKRTSFASALQFLEWNHVDTEMVDQTTFKDLILRVALGESSKGEVASYLRSVAG